MEEVHEFKRGDLVLVPMYGRRSENLGEFKYRKGNKLIVKVLDGINKKFVFNLEEVKPYPKSA